MLSSMTGLRLHHLAPENDDKDEDSDVDVEKSDGALPSTSTSTDSAPNGDKTRSKKDPNDSKDIEPKCKIEIRRWKQGTYTLLNDMKANNDKFYLDGRLFFNCLDWNLECGGFTSYFAKVRSNQRHNSDLSF